MGITFKGEVPTFADLPAGAVQGDLYVVADPVPAHGWVWDEVAAAWVDAGPVQGPQGIQGPQGVAGVQGPAGPSAVSADAGNFSVLGSDGFIFTPQPVGEVTLAGEESLSNKTLLSPKVDVILDKTYGNIVAGFSNALTAASEAEFEDLSRVGGGSNYVVLYGADSGSPATVFAAGMDANVGLDLKTRGTGQVTINGQPIGGSYTLPAATATTLGGVKVGSGVTVAADGTISVAAASGSYLPLAGGTMTGTIVAPTAVNAITFGTSTYGILGGTGGVSVRNGATNLMLATAANVAYAVPLQTQNSATALQFGSGGPTLGKGTNGIQASAAIDCATAPTVGTHLTNKTYVDSKVPVNAVAGSKAGLTLWTGTQAEYDAIAAKDANTVYVVS